MDLNLNRLFSRQTVLAFNLIFLAELFSFFAFFLPSFNRPAFIIIAALALILACYDLRYAMLMLFAELFIGSKGYLFFITFGDMKISLRLALWLAVMLGWTGKIIWFWFKNKKFPKKYFVWPQFEFFWVLAFFVALALIRGLYLGNSGMNVFFDFNNWLYFLIIFPLAMLMKDDAVKSDKGGDEFKYKLGQVFIAATAWLSFKTIILAAIFLQGSFSLMDPLYRWVRNSGVGEITKMPSGFFRIFFQSHIYPVVAWIMALAFWSKELAVKKIKKNDSDKVESQVLASKTTHLWTIFLSAIWLAAVLLSFSRSFWFGLLFAVVFIFVAAIISGAGKRFLKLLIKPGLSLILSLLIILTIVMAPAALSGWKFGLNVFSDRIGGLDSEAAAVSRWALLGPLWGEISARPVLGAGFGKTVTYQSSDPRVLKSLNGGVYTTYAFEWGWLDLWLKLGVFGILAYILFLGSIIKTGWIKFRKGHSFIALGFVAALVFLIATNIFTPYLNHPLGIGLIILSVFGI